MSLRSRITTRLARLVVRRTMRNGLDLRALRRMPERLTFPFRRDGLDPVAETGELREHTPVARLGDFFGRGVWLVTGYDDNRALLADGTSFSNDLGQFVSQEGRSAEEQIGGLGMTDPPLHTELRRYLTPEFTKRKLARLEPLIEGIVAAQLDAIEEQGPEVDLVEDFAFPIPFEVICELLGLPVEDRERFGELGVARFDLSQGGVGSFGAAAASREFLIGAVARQRDEPGPGLIGGLLTEHGDQLDDVTLGGIADGVFLGGYETSASMLALGSYLVARTPAARELLIAGDESADRVVEELLRHLTVVQVAFPRFARVDVPSPTVVSSPPATSSASPWSPPTATPSWSTTPTPSTRPARPRDTSRSATACTAASAPSWHGWSCGSPCASWSAGSPTCTRPPSSRSSSSASSPPCTASPRCPRTSAECTRRSEGLVGPRHHVSR